MLIHFPNRSLLLSCIFILTGFVVKSQTFVGAGYGTFNIPGSDYNSFRGMGPTVKIEHISDDETGSIFIDVSSFTKSFSSVNQYAYKYTYLYSQIGFKKFFSSYAIHRFIPFAGAGVALLTNKTSVTFTGNNTESTSSDNRFLWGFHFNAGVQYSLKKVTFELKGNFDLTLKPLQVGKFRYLP